MNVLIALAATVVAVIGFPTAQQKVSASAAWVKAPAAGETSAQAFAVVENPTMYDVYVVSATSDVAASVEFEKAAATPGGKPQPLTDITAPAYGSVALKPDGIHLLLTGLTKPIKAGDKVSITLTTDNGAQLTVSADVRP